MSTNVEDLPLDELAKHGGLLQLGVHLQLLLELRDAALRNVTQRLLGTADAAKENTVCTNVML
jgi:hypothetical protein